jgi:hypothetical protein
MGQDECLAFFYFPSMPKRALAAIGARGNALELAVLRSGSIVTSVGVDCSQFL